MEGHLSELQRILESVQGNTAVMGNISSAADALREVLLAGGSIYIAGNGGSAAEAQHFAAEIVGRYKKERGGYPAVALTTDTSILTAVGNDFGFDAVFARQVEALGRAGDALVVLSTSGNSENIIRAAKAAKAKGMRVIALLGKDGGRVLAAADIAVVVPSDSTERIQEVHLLIIHSWCDAIERDLK